jgi:Fic family protein
MKPPAELSRRNRIKTIKSSLEIEGNSMTVEQITDLINNKRVLAP